MTVAERNSIVVGGMTPFTTIDFPGRLAAVVFCQGCPWCCSYCQNPHLLSQHRTTTQPWPEVAAWLDKRRGLLDGVVFSGGEPLLQRGLNTAIADVRAMRFAAALHTAGPYPKRLQTLLPLLDWVGFDVKAPFDDYRRVTGADVGETVSKSLAILVASGIHHEVRCTVDERVLKIDDLCRMAKQLTAMGVSRLVLQARRNNKDEAVLFDRQLLERVSEYMAYVQLRKE